MPIAGDPLGTFGHWVTPRLATGGALVDPASVQALRLAGVTGLVNTQAERDDSGLVPDLAYLWNGVADDAQPKDASWFARSLEFALPLLARPGQRLYVYCGAGSNRGPSTAYAILRAVGFPPALALSTIQNTRMGAVVAYAADADHAIELLGYG